MSQATSTASSGQSGKAAITGSFDPAVADELREAMVRRLREEDLVVSERVAAAFAAVPRHLFAPGNPWLLRTRPMGP